MTVRIACSVLAAVALIVSCGGCAKKTEQAKIVGKEYIPAHVEGTEYKEREMEHEQWLVEVQMEDGRRTNAPVDEAQWKTLKVGDRVQAKYSQGKYTGTIWGIDIQKE